MSAFYFPKCYINASIGMVLIIFFDRKVKRVEIVSFEKNTRVGEYSIFVSWSYEIDGLVLSV